MSLCHHFQTETGLLIVTSDRVRRDGERDLFKYPLAVHDLLFEDDSYHCLSLHLSMYTFSHSHTHNKKHTLTYTPLFKNLFIYWLPWVTLFPICYRVGPLHSDVKYRVTAEKTGYVITKDAEKGDVFRAFKLGEISVQVSIFFS